MSNDLPLQTDRAVSHDQRLVADAGDPVIVVNPESETTWFVICEHAGNAVPSGLDNLGLTSQQLESHIAWDPGAAPLARLIAEKLDATVVLQRYSRLVYDCNRPPQSSDAMRDESEGIVIPGNKNLSADERDWRTDTIYHAFHGQIDEMLDERVARGVKTMIATVHSFTPVFEGRRRDVELGVLFDSDERLAEYVMSCREDLQGLDVRRNEPYGPEDGVTHTLKLHGIKRQLPNVMLEVRNDLIKTEQAKQEWAERICRILNSAAADLSWTETE